MESKISTLSLLEDVKILKNLLKEEDETIQEENPLDNLPDASDETTSQPEAPTASTTFTQEESPEDVAEEGVSELLVSIIQKYGLDSEIIDKLLNMGRELTAPTETPEVSDGESSDQDLLGLDTEATDTGEPSPEDTGDDTGIEDLLSSYTTGENPEENSEENPEQPVEGEAPEENPEVDQEQTEQERIEAEQKLADEEEEKPLDLADFSFKN